MSFSLQQNVNCIAIDQGDYIEEFDEVKMESKCAMLEQDSLNKAVVLEKPSRKTQLGHKRY